MFCSLSIDLGRENHHLPLGPTLLIPTDFLKNATAFHESEILINQDKQEKQKEMFVSVGCKLLRVSNFSSGLHLKKPAQL